MVPPELRLAYWEKAFSRDLKGGRDYLKKASRCAAPMWSMEALQGHTLSSQDSTIFAGHNYQMALIIDRFLREGLQKFILEHNKSNQHFITEAQTDAMFSPNVGRRLWDDTPTV